MDRAAMLSTSVDQMCSGSERIPSSFFLPPLINGYVLRFRFHYEAVRGVLTWPSSPFAMDIPRPGTSMSEIPERSAMSTPGYVAGG